MTVEQEYDVFKTSVKSEHNVKRKFMRYFCIVLIFISNQVFAQVASGTMECTVTGSVVIASEEGQFKVYSMVKDGVKAKENLTLNYDVGNDYIYIELKRNRADNNIVINSHLSTKNLETTAVKSSNGGFVLINKNFNHSISFLPDYIRVKGFREFVISRYYKNDWHGIFSDVRPTETFAETLTLNCRHTNDKMEAAFKFFTGFNK